MPVSWGSLTALAVLLVAGCGGQPDVLGQASRALPEVRSGDLDLRMAVSAGDAASQVGFQERGPFSLPKAGAVPVARTEVSHFVGTANEATTFISTGRKAYIEISGQVYELPQAAVQRLRQGGGGGSLAGLQVDRWVGESRVADGGQVDGVTTDRVSGPVNTRQFVNDVMQLSRGLGQAAAVPQVNPAEAADLARAVRASHFDLWAGRDDHLVRRLTVSIEFGAPSSPASAALARYSRTRMELTLDLTHVNRPVTVPDPPGARPFSEYCARQPDAGACAATPS